MHDTLQETDQKRSVGVSIAIYTAMLFLITATGYVVFVRIGETSTRNVSVVMFAVISVVLRTVSSLSRNKIARYAIAAVAVLVFVLIAQLF